MIVDLTGNVLAEQSNEVSEWDRWDAREIWKKWVINQPGVTTGDGKMKYPDLMRATIVVADALLDDLMRGILKICTCKAIRAEVAELIDAWEKRQEGWQGTAHRIAELDRAEYEARKNQ